LGIEAVQELLVAGVFNDFLGLPFTSPDIEVLDGRELSLSNVLGCPHNQCCCHTQQ
jgi:hypothetical protein